MHKTHGCATVRKTWEAIGVCCPWQIRTKSLPCDAIVTCVFPVLCVFLRFLVQFSMNPYVYPTGFGRCPFECSAGPCRRLTDFGTSYGLSCKYCMGAFWTTTNLYGPKMVGSPSLKAVHPHLSATGYTAPYGSKKHRKSYKRAARSSTQSDQGFRYAHSWETRPQCFFIRTTDS